MPATAIPVVVTENPVVEGRTALRVVAVTEGPVEGRPSLPVVVITDEDLLINGGTYVLDGAPTPYIVMETTARPTTGRPAIPVYVVGGSLGPLPPASDLNRDLVAYWSADIGTYDGSTLANIAISTGPDYDMSVDAGGLDDVPGIHNEALTSQLSAGVILSCTGGGQVETNLMYGAPDMTFHLWLRRDGELAGPGRSFFRIDTRDNFNNAVIFGLRIASAQAYLNINGVVFADTVFAIPSDEFLPVTFGFDSTHEGGAYWIQVSGGARIWHNYDEFGTPYTLTCDGSFLIQHYITTPLAMDELAVWHRSLTEAEVELLAQESFYPLW